MNQYDTLIRDFLFDHGYISFEKIGTLTLNNKSISQDQPIPPAAISFQFDKRAITSPELAEYISAKTGKNKTLIGSDLESFVEMMRQFMNIGNPYEIEGIGILKLAKSGEYEFSAFDLTNKKEEARTSKTKKQKEKYDSPLTVKKSSNRNALILFALVIILGILGVIGWGSYKLFIENKNKTASAPVDSIPPVVQDTVAHMTVDTTAIQDTSATNILAVDTSEYKFIHEITTSSTRAYTRANSLKQYGYPSMLDSIKGDSLTHYVLYLKYRLSSADTAMMRDSLQKLLQKRIRINHVSPTP